jgi:hypothetical protein
VSRYLAPTNTEIILAALLEDDTEVAEALNRRGFFGLMGKILGAISANPFSMAGAATPVLAPAAWQPSPAHLAWFTALLNRMQDGQQWAVPATGQVYQLDKNARTLALVSGSPNDPLGWHERNKVALGRLGYGVLDMLPGLVGGKAQGKAQEPDPGLDRCWKCGKPGTHALMPPLGGSVCDDCWSELNTDADILKKKGDAEVEANKKQRKERRERERPDDRSRFDYAGGSEDEGYAKHYESSLNTKIILTALLQDGLI